MRTPRISLGALLCVYLPLMVACGGDDAASTNETPSSPAQEADEEAEAGLAEADDGSADLDADTLRRSLEQSGVEVVSLTVTGGTATVVLPTGGESQIDVVCPATEPFVDEVVVLIDGVEQPC